MIRLAYAAAIAALLAISPTFASAQNAAPDHDGWWDWALPDAVELGYFPSGTRLPLPRPDARDRSPDTRDRAPDTRSRIPDRRDRPGSAAAGQRQGHGPPFCRDGSGHPVHGMQWCRDKGWATGLRLPRWEPAGWGDVVLRGPRDGRRHGTADRDRLIDILGDVVFGRMDQHRAVLGADGPLTGRWVIDPSGARILQVRAGSVPVAEFTDLHGTGRADAILLNSGS